MKKKLIIGGGGMKIIAVIGTLEILDDLEFLKHIDDYAGSSAGALICFY